MEAILRWFEGLSSSSSSSSADHRAISQSDVVQQPPSSASTDEQQEEELIITVELDMSGLKPIKVPERTNHRLASMGHHKVSHTPSVCNPAVEF